MLEDRQSGRLVLPFCIGEPSAKVLAAELGEDWRELRGWEVERWFERLPMFLFKEPKRQKVVKALRKALELAESG
jgi:hypothetical protein